MKIASLEIPDGLLGLRATKLQRLGRVVLLAGPNGSGKSRVLNVVETMCQGHLSRIEMHGIRREIDSLKEEVVNAQNRVESAYSEPAINFHKKQLRQFAQQLEDKEGHVRRSESISLVDHDADAKPIVVRYSVRNLNFRGADELKRHEVRKAPEAIANNFGVAQSRELVIPAITQIAEAAAFARGAQGPGNASTHIALFQALSNSIEQLLGSSLGWDSESHVPTLFNRPIEARDLSEGQRVLLGIAVSLALQDGSLQDLILLLDEPETHLHPSALIDVLSRIDAACPNAQLWIATHSVHVLAHYGEQCIWAVRDGLATFAGPNWKSVLDSLLGGPDRIETLRGFLGLPSQVAATTFVAQCLLDAKVVDTLPGDPQTSQAAEFLLFVRADVTKPIRIVDYGVGEARLFNELVTRTGESLTTSIDYFAVDKEDVPEAQREKCIKRLVGSYGADGATRYFAGDEALRQQLEDGTADCIVLCNVLHEIDPSHWLGLIGPNGLLERKLAADGYLLVVEDQELSVGESAHRFNYLVLDHYELKFLFGESRESMLIRSEHHPDYPGRLKRHVIPKALLSRMSSASMRNSIEELQRSAEARANKIAGGKGARSGRQFAFWTMQHFNACQALKALPE